MESVSQRMFERIQEILADGGTVYLSTRERCMVITPATVAKFSKVGIEFLKMDAEGCLRVWRNRRDGHVCVATPTCLLVSFHSKRKIQAHG